MDRDRSWRRHTIGRAACTLTLLAASLAMAGVAHAGGPAGGQVISGVGQIQQSGNTTTIQQSTQNLSLNWQAFNIAQNETVNFLQPGRSSIAVNRVLSNTPSEIFGHLNANGQVWLINPNGVLFGQSAQVNVGGLVASTLNVNDDGGSSGIRTFSGNGKGSVVNQGNIHAADGGYVALIGNTVSNQGAITARLGTVAMGGGSAVTLTFKDNQLLHLQVDSSTLNNLAENRQLIVADGGQVIMTAGAKNSLLASTVNNTGVVRAQTVGTHDGQITLLGGMAAGTVNVGGTLDASAPQGGDGGHIETSAAHFALAPDARINASAGAGRAGTWLVDPVDLTIDAPAATTISSTLQGGTNVTEQTTATGATGIGTQTPGTGNINVNAGITWTNAAANLTLLAFNGINVNAPIHGAGAVTMQASGANIAIAAGSSIVGGTGVTLSTTKNFVNSAGSTAVSTGTASPWLIYSTNPTLDTAGGLTPSFIQYNAPAGTAAAASGNGFLYSVAPTLTVTGLTGTVSKVYDGTTAATLAGTNIRSTGLLNGNKITTATGAYAAPDADTGIDVTSPTAIGGFTITDTTGAIPVFGYKLGGTPITAAIGTITPRPLTATIGGNPTKVYNGTTESSPVTSAYQFGGFVTGQGMSVTEPSSVNYASANAGQNIPITATFTSTNFIPNSGTNLDNYILPTTAVGPGTIVPATLLIRGLQTNDKVYDGTTVDPIDTDNAALFGVIATDAGQVTLNTGGITGTFASPNVGNNLGVAISGFSLSGTQAGNYVIAAPTGLTASITPKFLTVAGLTASNKVYDATLVDALNLSAASLTGIVASDAGNVSLNASSATGTFSQSDVGNNLPVSATGLALAGSAAGNYAITPVTGLTANITPAPLSINFSGNPTKMYDGSTASTPASTDYTISGFVGGQNAQITQGTATYADKNAGSNIPVSVSLEPSDFSPDSGTKMSNYTFPATLNGLGTIDPAVLTVSIVGNPTKTFDGTDTASLVPGNYSIYGAVPGESITLGGPATGQYATSDAGFQPVSANLAAGDYAAGAGTLLSNYVLATVANGFGTIVPKPLSGSFNVAITGNPTKIYDGTTVATIDPSGFTLSGFVGSDSATVAHTITGAYATKNVGTQPVTATLAETDFTAGPGTDLNNYTFPVLSFGTGTILPAPLLVSIINNPTKVYNGDAVANVTSNNFLISGLVSGESATISPTTDFNYATPNAGATTVSGSLVPSNYVAGANTLLSNYTLAPSAAGPGTITKAPVYIVGLQANNKVYDQTNTATLDLSDVGLAGLVENDQGGTTTLNTTTNGTFAQVNVGNNIAVTPTGFSISGPGSSNYQLQPLLGLTANITPAPLTVSGVLANNKVYDGTRLDTFNTSAALLSGILPGDNVTLDPTNAVGMFGTSNVGTNLRVAASGFGLGGTSLGNYFLIQPTGLRANITPAPLSVNITGSPSKPYDGSTSVNLVSSDYTITGFVAGQSATIEQAANSSYATPNAGTGLGVTATLEPSDWLAGAGTLLSNYQLPMTATGNNGVITPKILNLIGTRVYDATTGANASIFGGGVLQGINGQTVSLTGSGVLTSKNVGTRGFAGLGTLVLGNGSGLASNYTLVGGVDRVTITPATLTVSGTTAANKIYNGNTTATLSGSVLNGVLGTDNVLLGNAATGTFNNKNVGNAKPVTTAMTVSGTDFSNYILIQPTGIVANITPLAITVTATGQNKPYDGTTTAGVSLASSGVLAGDRVTFTDTSANFSQADVGNNLAISVLGIGATGTDSGNYTFNNTATTSANITPRILNLTSTRVYDATTNAAASLFGSNGTLTGVNGETLTLSGTGTLSTKNVGVQQPFATNGLSGFTLTGVGAAKASNYTFAGGVDWVTITPAILTVSGTIADNKTYDATTTATIHGSVLNGLLGTDNVALTNTGTGTFNNKNVGNNKPVSTNFGLSGTDASNYIVQQPGGITANITPFGITVTATGSNKVYDGTTLANVTLGSTGVFAGDSVTFADTSANFATPNVGNNIAITVNGITGSGGDVGNYTILNNTATTAANITPRVLNLTGTRVYDATTDASANLFGANGVLTGVNGETLTLGGTGTLSTKNVGTQLPFAAGGLDGFTLSGNNGALASNYTLAGGIDWVTITPAQLLVSGTSVVTKIYDGTTAAMLTGSTLQGLLGSDSVVLGNDTTGTFDTKNVGTNKPVAYGPMTISGTDAGNYTLVQPGPLTGTITPLAITVGATGQDKVYDGNTTATVTLNPSGVLAGDTVNFADTGANFVSPNAANNIAINVAGISATGTDAGNYTFNTTTTTSANITPFVLNLTGSRVYDGSTNAAASLFGSSGVLTGTNNETLTLGGTGTLSTKNVGSQQPFAANGLDGFTLTGNNGALASNYTLAGGIDWVTITPLTINVSATGQNKVYDGNTNATVTLGSGGVVAGDNITFADTGANFTSPNAGNNIPINVTGITASGGDAGNYVINTTATTSANITPFVLDLTGTRVYDGTTNAAASLFGSNGVLTGTNNETLTLGGSGTLSTKNVGSQQPFAANGLTGFTLAGNNGALASNYTLTGGVDWVTITPLAITVNATGQDKTYDGTTTANVTLGSNGVLAGDSVSFTDAGANFNTPNAGTQIPILVNGIAGTGADAGNYTFNTTANTSANINPAILNLTGTRVYDATTDASASLFGNNGVLTGVNGETLTLGGSGTLSSKNVGNQVPFAANGLNGFTLTGDNGALAGNYTLAGGIDWVTITPAQLLVSGTSVVTKVYDGNTSATLTGSTLQGLLGSDSVALGNDTTGTFDTKNVGTGKPVTADTMTISGADAANYTLVQPGPLTGTITPLAITVNANGQNKPYDGSTTANVTLGSSGVLAGDSVSFTDAGANFNTPNAGTNIPIFVNGIAGSGADAGNYTFNTTANTSANINPAVLNLTGTRVYDATTNASASLFGNNGVLTGVNGETITLGGSGTVSSKNVGSQIPFAANGLNGFTLSGNNGALGSNYTLAGGVDWLSITPATLTVIGTQATSRPYDGTVIDPLTGATLTGVLGSDNVTLTNSAQGRFADAAIGVNKPVSTAMGVSGADAGNYILVQPTGLVADITAPTSGGGVGGEEGGGGGGQEGGGGGGPGPSIIPSGIQANLQASLGPDEINTPYGTADRDAEGVYTGNVKKERQPEERNRIRSDFHSGLSLNVVDGGVRVPVTNALP